MRILTLALLTIAAALSAGVAVAKNFPETFPLPNGFRPEGIAIGHGTDVYVGSIPTGAVWKGDLRTGRGDVLVEGQTGRAAIGLKIDHRERLFVAGGPTGKAFVYDADDGSDIAEFELVPAGTNTFVNDVTLAEKAAYFTDSRNAQLYVLDLGRRGRLPDTSRTLPLTGDFVPTPDPADTELNGIAATENGKRLIVVDSPTGRLFTVSPRSGRTEQIALTDRDGNAMDEPNVINGDGLLLVGDRTLYVVQNRLNRIAVVKLDRDLERGRIVQRLTDPDLDVPTTVARFGDRLYLPNARFGTPMPDQATYQVVQVKAKSKGRGHHRGGH
jgi:sugar lactone lactonase YvrE